MTDPPLTHHLDNPVGTGYSTVCPVCLVVHHPDHNHITLNCDCRTIRIGATDPARHRVDCAWRYQWLATWANEASRPPNWYEEANRRA